MRMKWWAMTAVAVAAPIVSVVGGSVEADRKAPLCVVDSEPANVRVEIVVDGAPAPVYRDGPYRWIEGRRGERFAFRVTNQNGFPVGVILSADGQSLTADGRASASHPAYVLGPRETETISVWREDLSGGRELVFTDVDRSLAALKGDRRNIGVLGVLVWRLEDRRPEPIPVLPPDDASKPGASPTARGSEDREASGIGVGAGNRVDDRAYLTDRYRRVKVLGTISIYYDDYDGLVRAGVDVRPRREIVPDNRRRADPFPGEYHGVRIP